MGRLVLTRFNKRTCKVEQLTLENVNLSAHYIDNFGRPTTLIHLIADNPACVQKSYIITEVTDERLVEGIHYNASEAAQKWWENYEKKDK